MLQGMTVASAKSDPAKPGEVTSISINRADNGFTVRAERRQKPRKGERMVDWEAGASAQVFNRHNEMLEHVGKLAEQMGVKAAKDAVGEL